MAVPRYIDVRQAVIVEIRYSKPSAPPLGIHSHKAVISVKWIFFPRAVLPI